MTIFDSKPRLSGRLISVRPLMAEDFDGLYQVASDPLLWEQHPEPERCELNVFRSWFDLAINEGALVVLDRASGAPIGSSRYYDIELKANPESLAIGYTFLSRDYWGGPTNSELKDLMLSHAFKSVLLVWLHIGEDNWRSRKAAEKIGAKLSHVGQRSGVPYCWYYIER